MLQGRDMGIALLGLVFREIKGFYIRTPLLSVARQYYSASGWLGGSDSGPLLDPLPGAQEV